MVSQETIARVERGLGASPGRARTLPLVAAVSTLFSVRGLCRGSTVAIVPGAWPGATSLMLSLLAGPSASGSWCAVVGLPELGLVAAARAGVDLKRLALVPFPGPKWATVTAAVLEGFDVVVLCPRRAASQAEARKLEARARERGSVLVVLAPQWPGRPEVRLEVTGCSWQGLGKGFGYLAGRELEVVAAGKGASCRPAPARLRPAC
jgi:membrane protein implicated in regulation of membrane protease activity